MNGVHLLLLCVGGAITSDDWAVTQILWYAIVACLHGASALCSRVAVLSGFSRRAFLPVALRYGTRTL